MSMTVADVIDRARRALADTGSVETQRWTDAAMRNYLNDALDEILAARPDLAIQDDGTLGTITDVTENTDTIDLLGDEFLEPLSGYVIMRCASEDSADTANAQRAEQGRRDWLTGLYGPARTSGGG